MTKNAFEDALTALVGQVRASAIMPRVKFTYDAFHLGFNLRKVLCRSHTDSRMASMDWSWMIKQLRIVKMPFRRVDVEWSEDVLRQFQRYKGVIEVCIEENFAQNRQHAIALNKLINKHIVLAPYYLGTVLADKLAGKHYDTDQLEMLQPLKWQWEFPVGEHNDLVILREGIVKMPHLVFEQVRRYVSGNLHLEPMKVLGHGIHSQA